MFQISANNRDQPDEVLLNDVRTVAQELGKSILTRTEYEAHGRFAPATVANRFGGWGRAVERAGLESSRHFGISAEEALSDLRSVASELGVQELSVQLYRSRGKYSQEVIVQRFGGWATALAAAGLQVSELYNPRIADGALYDNLERVWQSLGRQPTVNDMHGPLSRHSAHTYKRRFGGWRKALEAFVAATSAQPPEASPEEARLASSQYTLPATSPLSVGRHRGVGWRQRYVVLSRDRFACRACGRSPATHPGVSLQVDHLIPWAKGGLTTDENLQTLCQECNGGKGDCQ